MNKFYVSELPKESTPIDDIENAWADAGQSKKLDKTSFNMVCSVCGNAFKASVEELHPRISNCKNCNSTVRWRSVAAITSILLSGRAVPLPMLPPRPEVTVFGMSCPRIFDDKLTDKVDLWNTFFDNEPRFDITDLEEPFPGPFDLAISVEILEHVPPPVSKAFENLYKILKPGGILLMTVPFGNKGETLEHYPNLHDYHLEERNGKQVLINITREGKKEEFGDLVFHGGSGFTLEIRRFSRRGLMKNLTDAGFGDIQFFDSSILPLGVYFPNKWSLPLIAIK